MSLELLDDLVSLSERMVHGLGSDHGSLSLNQNGLGSDDLLGALLLLLFLGLDQSVELLFLGLAGGLDDGLSVLGNLSSAASALGSENLDQLGHIGGDNLGLLDDGLLSLQVLQLVAGFLGLFHLHSLDGLDTLLLLGLLSLEHGDDLRVLGLSDLLDQRLDLVLALLNLSLLFDDFLLSSKDLLVAVVDLLDGAGVLLEWLGDLGGGFLSESGDADGLGLHGDLSSSGSDHTSSDQSLLGSDDVLLALGDDLRVLGLLHELVVSEGFLLGSESDLGHLLDGLDLLSDDLSGLDVESASRPLLQTFNGKLSDLGLAALDLSFLGSDDLLSLLDDLRVLRLEHLLLLSDDLLGLLDQVLLGGDLLQRVLLELGDLLLLLWGQLLLGDGSLDAVLVLGAQDGVLDGDLGSDLSLQSFDFLVFWASGLAVGSSGHGSGSGGSLDLVGGLSLSVDNAVGDSEGSELVLDLGLALGDDLLDLLVSDSLLLAGDGVLVLLVLSDHVSLLGGDLGGGLNWVLGKGLAVSLQPLGWDLLELLGTWDDLLLVLDATLLVHVDADESVVLLSVVDVLLVAVSVTLLVESVVLTVESWSEVLDFSADSSFLLLAGKLWEDGLLLDAHNLVVVGGILDASLESVEGLLGCALAILVELNASLDLHVVVSRSAGVSGGLSVVLVSLLDALVTVVDDALALSVDGLPLDADLVGVVLNTVSSVWSDGVSGTLALLHVFDLLLLEVLSDLLQSVVAVVDGLLLLLDFLGQFLGFLLHLDGLGLDLGDLLLQLLLVEWGSLDLQLLLQLVSSLLQLSDFLELGSLLLDQSLADVGGLLKGVLDGDSWVFLGSLLLLGLDLLDLDLKLLDLGLGLLAELLDLNLLGLQFLGLDDGLLQLGFVLLSDWDLDISLDELSVLASQLFKGEDLLLEHLSSFSGLLADHSGSLESVLGLLEVLFFFLQGLLDLNVWKSLSHLLMHDFWVDLLKNRVDVNSFRLLGKKLESTGLRDIIFRHVNHVLLNLDDFSVCCFWGGCQDSS